MGAIALNLHGFYTGVERIFKQIAQTIDGSVPDTADWHRLSDYCSFRHVVRNIYSIHLRRNRIEPLVDDLPTCLERLQGDLRHWMASSGSATATGSE